MWIRRLGSSLVVLFALVCFPTAVAAASGTTYTWIGNSQGTGGDNHSWTDSRNWNPAGVPGAGDSVVIEQPSSTDCFAHVDTVPTVTLVNFTLAENPTLCTTSVSTGAISVTGSFTWDGGNLNTPTTIESGATAVVNGSNQRLNSLTQTLDVAGTLTLSGLSAAGALQVLHGQVLHLEPGSSLHSSGTNQVDGSECCTDPAKVVNQGTIAISGGTLTLATLELDQKATIATSLGGQLVTSAGPVTATAGGAYTGNGRWLLTGGSAARFSGTQTLGSTFHLELGGLTSNSSSSLAGTTTLAGTGTFDWTGGVIDAQLTIAHGLSVQVVGVHTGGGQRVLQGRDFSGGGGGVPVTQTNHGVITVANGATISTSSQAHLVNAADGVVAFQPGTAMASQACCTAPDRFTNAGTVRVATTGGSGPVVLTGIGYQTTATTAIASGQTLQLAGGAPNKLIAGTISGGGHLLITAPTAVSGAPTVATGTRLVLDAHGTLDGTATIGGAGAMTWTGGSMSGAVTVSTQAGIAISGSSVKTIANVGGGSTPSTVTFTMPATIAAGTSNAHDVIDVGSSVLVLTRSTTVGTFTDFDNGTVSNRATFSIHAGKVSARNYVQTSTGRFAVDLGATSRGALTSIGTVTLHGSLVAHNTFTPVFGAKVTVVTAGTLTDSLSCVGTTGKGISGSSAGHWANTHTTTKVILVWRRGVPPTC
jgi:hypothetical protein